MEEIWKPIIIEKNGEVFNYTGLYEISNHGRVRSLNYRQTGQIKVMKPKKHSSGYLYTGLCKNGKREMFRIHRLVATAFIPNDDPEHKTEVNHLNENKHDNRVENLEWCTPSENVNHGTHNERVAKANSKKVICIETGEIFDSTWDVQRKLGLAQSNISACCNGKYKTCGKLHWKYYKDYLIDINERNEKLLIV